MTVLIADTTVAFMVQESRAVDRNGVHTVARAVCKCGDETDWYDSSKPGWFARVIAAYSIHATRDAEQGT